MSQVSVLGETSYLASDVSMEETFSHNVAALPHAQESGYQTLVLNNPVQP